MRQLRGLRLLPCDMELIPNLQFEVAAPPAPLHQYTRGKLSQPSQKSPNPLK